VLLKIIVIFNNTIVIYIDDLLDKIISHH